MSGLDGEEDKGHGLPATPGFTHTHTTWDIMCDLHILQNPDTGHMTLLAFLASPAAVTCARASSLKGSHTDAKSYKLQAIYGPS